MGDTLEAQIDRLQDQEREINDRIRRLGCLAAPNRKRPRDFEGNVPRVLPKHKDPELAGRARRFLRALIKPKKEEAQLPESEACKHGSVPLNKAEQKVQPDEQQIEEKMISDLHLRARYAIGAEEKILKLHSLRLREHHKKLDNFLRTKAEPPIYYSFAKQLEEEDPTSVKERKELAFREWEGAKDKELSEYLSQIKEEQVAKVNIDYRRWLDGRKTSTGNDVQETEDKELGTHGVERMPKKPCYA